MKSEKIATKIGVISNLSYPSLGLYTAQFYNKTELIKR